jgi:hypothetical protein
MTWPRQPRRICRRPSCGERCKKPYHVYCSDACHRAHRAKKPAPLCPVCRERPCGERSGGGYYKTCGRVCGAVHRADTRRTLGPHAYLAGLRKMGERSKSAYLTRMAAYLKEQIAELDAATTPLERAKVAARVYRKGYSNGSSAAYYRYAVKPTRAKGTSGARDAP